GGRRIESLDKASRLHQAAKVAPVLRGMCSSERKMVGHFTDDERVLEFINSVDMERLAAMGTSCPDHFLRTKISPLVVNLAPDIDSDDTEKLKELLAPLFSDYRNMYREYYETCR